MRISSIALDGVVAAAVCGLTGASEGLVYGHPELGPCIAVAASNYHFAAVRADGQVVCWGSNEVGQCDVPLGLGPCLSVAANGQAQSSGPGFTVALRVDGGVVAWGYNGAGQCSIPIGLGPCKQVAAGFKNTLVLRQNGTLAAWGQAEFGQCAVPSATCSRIAAGNYHGLALTLTGEVLQWGTCAPPPNGLGPCIDIAGGMTFSVALRADGTVVQWGLGNTEFPRSAGRCISVSCSDYGIFAIRESHTVISWPGSGPLTDHSDIGPCLVVAGIYSTDFTAILTSSADTDVDGVFDEFDNCPSISNPSQADCDGDGIGDACEVAAGAVDVNQDGIPDSCQCLADLFVDHKVDGGDLGVLLAQWGVAPPGTVGDINSDGAVDGADLGALLAARGPCPN